MENSPICGWEEKALQLRKAGKTIRYIAEVMRVPKSSLHRFLKENGAGRYSLVPKCIECMHYMYGKTAGSKKYKHYCLIVVGKLTVLTNREIRTSPQTCPIRTRVQNF